MKCILGLVLMMVALSHQHAPFEDHHHWELFKVHHMKDYVTEKEEELRKGIFLESLKFVREHNAKFERGEVTFQVAINRFADLTADEFGALFNGFKRALLKARYGKKFDLPLDTELPESVDWRMKGAVTEVKDQGQCGSCWAFSATGALEGQTFVAKKKLVSLSEQNLIDCAKKGGNQGCNGGFMDLAYIYVKRNGGIDTEESYPYEGEDGKCRYKAKTKGATDTGFVDIPTGSEHKLKAAVAIKGPVSVAVQASHISFQLYKSGVYKSPLCGNKEQDLDHGVLVVGYGSGQTGDYWLVKNSWGVNWGMNGYMLLARNHHNMCGVATTASYPTV